MKRSIATIALVGNPNTGKSSLFNQLTGLNQKVGNYPGVTVDKKLGSCKINASQSITLIDFPGAYSINPESNDEAVTINALINSERKDYPDAVIVVSEVENLKRNLFLFSQIKDFSIPTLLVINMSDLMTRKGIAVDLEKLKDLLKSDVILVSSRKKQGIADLKEAIKNHKQWRTEPIQPILEKIDNKHLKSLLEKGDYTTSYKNWLSISNKAYIKIDDTKANEVLETIEIPAEAIKQISHKEIIYRYQLINDILKETVTTDQNKATHLRAKLDKVLTHRVYGYLIFSTILFLIFQSVFEWSQLPMDFIDQSFTNLSRFVKDTFPDGVFVQLVAEGIIPGIGGIVIFIPQIAFLFMFIALLEETGYMSRVVFLMDKIMRKFGMNGKSVIPLISGTACAIPAIMATRTISSWRERLITILIVPFTTCSARLPVYAILIALIIPNHRIGGIIGIQGLTFMALYLIGFIAALTSSFLLHKVLKTKQTQNFLIEMPNYKFPSAKNIFIEVYRNTKSFVFGAGKIILAISVVLWFLASRGPSKYFTQEMKSNTEFLSLQNSSEFSESYKLEHSYLGLLGRSIEPAIEPMGYDWKIGIALLSSFAAREVFVGTLATIYNVESEESETIKKRMSSEINPKNGEKRFNLPTGLSLLIFYAFAMQCMGTLAIVKRETRSWKWPILQFFGMGILAYITAVITFHLFQ